MLLEREFEVSLKFEDPLGAAAGLQRAVRVRLGEYVGRCYMNRRIEKVVDLLAVSPVLIDRTGGFGSACVYVKFRAIVSVLARGMPVRVVDRGTLLLGEAAARGPFNVSFERPSEVLGLGKIVPSLIGAVVYQPMAASPSAEVRQITKALLAAEALTVYRIIEDGPAPDFAHFEAGVRSELERRAALPAAALKRLEFFEAQLDGQPAGAFGDWRGPLPSGKLTGLLEAAGAPAQLIGQRFRLPALGSCPAAIAAAEGGTPISAANFLLLALHRAHEFLQFCSDAAETYGDDLAESHRAVWATT